MKKVAITGNIGSGKSWVCELFKQRLGIPVYNSDDAAKQMYFQPDVRKKLVNCFGNAFYHSDTELNRKYIADLIFSDENAQRDLEGILYPALFVDFEQWMGKQNAPYVLFESALVFEKRLEKQFDAIVMVSASEKTRLRRAMERDHCNEATIRARMAKQWPEEGKRLLADYVIWHEHDDEDEVLMEQIMRLHGQWS
jgi:dephospho-CoA kinase